MKSTTPRRPRWARRILTLTACGVLLWRLCAAWGIHPLPGGGLTDAQAQSLRTLLLGAEVGSLTSEETSLWTALVTTEVPLTVPEPEPEPETELAATDILPETEVEPEPEPEPEPESEPESEPETEPEPEEETDVVAETITSNGSTVTGGGLELNNSTSGITVDLNDLAQTALTQRISSAEEGPQILIMHTHATEAYTMAGDDYYTETDTSRTDDENYNVIRIGEEMKAVFEEMGLSVIHDKTLYDYPSYTGSYARSLAGIQALLEEYPSISVVLDVHRDALIAEDGTVYKAVTQIDGESTAQVMLVVGTNDGGLEHPNWEQNLALAAHIQLEMEGICDTLARPINLRSQRFNQHVTPCSLLVEVGTSGNTLQEAIRGARYFAQAAGAVYLGLVDS